jgi:hypothetical protein
MDHNRSNNGFNDLQPQIEQHALNINTSCSYTDYFPVTGNNTIPGSYISNYEQQPMFFNDEHATSTTTYVTQQHDQLVNSFQTNSEIFRFEIPGFKIIITCIPTTSSLVNLDMQNQFQQNYSSNIVNDNSQTQFQQDYTSPSIVADNSQIQFQQNYTPSNNIVNDNSQTQFQQDYNSSNIANDNDLQNLQQNSNESFIDF